MEEYFKPDYTPRQIIQNGAFGGTYFRAIFSRVTGKYYKDAYKEFPFLRDLDTNLMTRPWHLYDASINKYGVKVGSTLEFWENKGWISPQDPYGWFQWYCRYYMGRRSDDDQRQIKRWLSFKKRFDGKKNPSPAIKQSLLHWGIAA